MKVSLELSITIDVPLEQLWHILVHDFEKVSLWASPVATSAATPRLADVPEGATVGGRVCSAPGFGELHESFLYVNTPNKAFAYSAEAKALPAFVSELQNHFRLHALSPDKPLVHSKVSVNLAGWLGQIMQPVMMLRFRRTLRISLDDLRHYAEKGQASPRKLEAQTTAARETVA